jgi:hypothetical protein
MLLTKLHPPQRHEHDLDATPPPADDEDRWRPIGEIDPVTGRSTVDLEKARRWTPLAELRRW